MMRIPMRRKQEEALEPLPLPPFHHRAQEISQELLRGRGCPGVSTVTRQIDTVIERWPNECPGFFGEILGQSFGNRVSVFRGRCGPCCSHVPTGTIICGLDFRYSATSVQVRSSNLIQSLLTNLSGGPMVSISAAADWIIKNSEPLRSYSSAWGPGSFSVRPWCDTRTTLQVAGIAWVLTKGTRWWKNGEDLRQISTSTARRAAGIESAAQSRSSARWPAVAASGCSGCPLSMMEIVALRAFEVVSGSSLAWRSGLSRMRACCDCWALGPGIHGRSTFKSNPEGASTRCIRRLATVTASGSSASPRKSFGGRQRTARTRYAFRIGPATNDVEPGAPSSGSWAVPLLMAGR